MTKKQMTFNVETGSIAKVFEQKRLKLQDGRIISSYFCKPFGERYGNFCHWMMLYMMGRFANEHKQDW